MARPVSTPSASVLLTALDPIVFNSDRDGDKRLDSSPLCLAVRLGAPTKKILAELVVQRRAACRTGDAWADVLQNNVFVEILRFDGRAPEVFVPTPGGDGVSGTMTLFPAPPLKFTTPMAPGFSATIPGVIKVEVARKFPLSSAHGNAPMLFAVFVCDEVILSTPFHVNAKLSKSGKLKAHKEKLVPPPTPGRMDRLRRIATFSGDVPVPPVAAPAPLAAPVLEDADAPSSRKKRATKRARSPAELPPASPSPVCREAVAAPSPSPFDADAFAAFAVDGGALPAVPAPLTDGNLEPELPHSALSDISPLGSALWDLLDTPTVASTLDSIMNL